MAGSHKPFERVTISQVAEAAGVSRATVSRAFSRPHVLKAETVARIRAVAQTLGYAPNQTARALSTGRHGNIAIIVPDVANPFFPPLIRAAQEAAYEADYCVFLGNSDESGEREDGLVGRFAGQVEGLILASSRLPEARIRALAAMKPLVLVNRDVAGIPRVLIDTAGGAADGVRHLVALGHRRIVYVTGPAVSWSNEQRRIAVRRAAAAAGVEMVALPAVRPSFEAGRKAVAAILQSGATAAIAFDDLTSQGVLAGLHERGLTAPDALSLIGCDDVAGPMTWPPLSTISSRSREAGEIAVHILFDILRGRGVSDARYVLDTALVLRGTCGPPPQS